MLQFGHLFGDRAQFERESKIFLRELFQSWDINQFVQINFLGQPLLPTLVFKIIFKLAI